MKKWFLILSSILFLMPIQSFALSCAGPWDPEGAYHHYDGVALGYADKVFEKNGATQIVRVNVIESYKGVKQNWIFVEEETTWDTRSIEGNKYLYFLNKKRDNWENPLCSQTRVKSQATNDLSYLEKFKPVELLHIDKPDDPFFGWPMIGGVSALVLVIGGLIFKVRKHYNNS